MDPCLPTEDKQKVIQICPTVEREKEQDGVHSNYIARQYGVKSAMPTSRALQLCKDLVLLPVNMPKYKEVASRIHRIFHEFTPLVEPLSLDEAYLEVTGSSYCKGSATLIAQAIRQRIWETENLTASAGVAPNKFLAKIASGWKKPNGLFVIRPDEVEAFVKTLAVNELFGVGKVTAEKLHQRGLKTCADLQKLSYSELTQQFGKLGQHLYEQCRGLDHRAVIPHRERKSLSVEHTFPQDITDKDQCLAALKIMHEKLLQRVKESAPTQPIKNQYIKIKYSNFRLVTTELASNEINFDVFKTMFIQAYIRIKIPIRLIGVGVHFNTKENSANIQQSLF